MKKVKQIVKQNGDYRGIPLAVGQDFKAKCGAGDEMSQAGYTACLPPFLIRIIANFRMILRSGKKYMVEGQRLEVNPSVDRYQKEIQNLAAAL